MSLALVENLETQSLAAPVELHAMLPPVLVSESPRAVAVEVVSAVSIEPNFLSAARAYVARHPDSPVGFVRLAQAEEATGNVPDAINAAKRTLAMTRERPDASITLAAVQILIHAGATDDARSALRSVPDGPTQRMLEARLAIADGDHDAALKYLADLETLEALTMRGWLALEVQRFEEAVKMFRRALNSGAPNPTILVNLAYAHAALGSRQKAIREMIQARNLAPGNRLVGLNLVSYYLADQQFELSLSEVKRLREFSPTDLQLAFAEAEVHLRARDERKAEATLRRARTSTIWATADAAERSELAANLAFLEWRLGKRSREDAKRIIIEELKRGDDDGLSIAGLLPYVARSARDLGELDAILRRLVEKHPEAPLFALKVHLALLRTDFANACDLALTWANTEIFNPNAAATAVFLLTDVKGDAAGATELGLAALRRAGRTEQLVNNVAYALALAGRIDEAKRLLPADAGDSVYFNATRGLVEILGGSIDAGIADYDRAYELATQSEDDDLPELVTVNKLLALWRASQRGLLDGRGLRIPLPAGWRERPSLVLVKQVVDREGAPAGEAEAPA